MASASVSTLVIFIAAVSIAAGVSGAMVTTVGDISASLDDRGADVARSIDTDTEIISDPGSGAVYDGADTVTLLVKNTGDRTIPTDGTNIEVLIDGQYTTPDSIEVLGGDSEWRAGAVVRVTVTRTLGSGDHRATAIVGSERETLSFRVGP